jgi:hypothetical protein
MGHAKAERAKTSWGGSSPPDRLYDARGPAELEITLVQAFPAAAPSPLSRAAGRHQRDCSGGGRHIPLYSLVPQVHLLGRPDELDKPVVGEGGLVEFKGGLRAAAHRLQANPSQPAARRLSAWDPHAFELVQGPNRAAGSRLHLLHDLHPQNKSRRWRRCAFNSESSCCRTATGWAMVSGFTRSPQLGHQFPSPVLARRGLCENAGKRNRKGVPKYSDYCQSISGSPVPLVVEG